MSNTNQNEDVYKCFIELNLDILLLLLLYEPFSAQLLSDE